MTLRAAVTGEVATTIEDAAGDSHDVRVRLRADQRRYADDLLALRVPDRQGRRQRGQDPGAAAARWRRPSRRSGPSTIRRKDLQREVRISAANSDRSPAARSTGDIERRGRRLSTCPPATTSCRAATPRS